MATALDRAASDAPARSGAPASRQAPARSRRRIGLLVGLVVALAAGAGVLVVKASSPGSISFAVPASYSVTYAVTTPRAPVSTERLWVRRPFDSVDISYAGPPPGTTVSLVLVYRLGVQVLKAADAQAGLLHVPAGTAPQDVRADVLVPAALAAHRLKAVGRQRVLGRSCRVFRSAAPLRAGALPALRAGSSYVDTCIDADGIVLREQQVADGRTVSERRAVAVSIGGAAVAGAPFAMTGSETPFDQGGGAFQPLTFGSRPPGSSWALRAAPAGFRHIGRYAVVPPQPQLFGAGSGGGMGLPGGLVTEMDDVFVRGSDAIVLQQGSTLNGAPFTPPANALPVELGRLGRGQLLLAPNGTTVVAEPGNGKQFVRLSGTLPRAVLVALMRSLLPQPGGTLTRLGAGAS